MRLQPMERPQQEETCGTHLFTDLLLNSTHLFPDENPLDTTFAGKKVHWSEIRRAVLSRDGHRCQIPGCISDTNLTIHHIVPKSDGGSNEISNLVTLCEGCHRDIHRFGLGAMIRSPRIPEKRVIFRHDVFLSWRNRKGDEAVSPDSLFAWIAQANTTDIPCLSPQ